MIIGKLRKRIAIQSNGEVADSYGQLTKTWTTLDTRYAAVEPLQGRELLQAQQVDSLITHKISMRYYAANTKMRVLYGSRIFNITSVINVDERNLYTVLMCQEAV